MEITKKQDNETLTLELSGRLDTNTASMLEDTLRSSLEGVKELVIDFEKLEYISSAGLRVILGAQKVMNKQGSLKIRNVNADIKEIFDITGFSDILTIV